MAENSIRYDSEKKIWYGPHKEYLYGNMGIPEVIYNFLKANPEHVPTVCTMLRVSCDHDRNLE